MTAPELLEVRGGAVRLRVADPAEPDALVATRSYVAELDARFPGGFEPGPLPPEPEATYLLASHDGEPVGYGGIRPVPTVAELGQAAARVAEIKRMWVHADWRGVGLGSGMLRRLEDLARERGFTHVVLDTNGTLAEAIAMYDRAGYQRIGRYNDNPYAEAFFLKDLSPRG